MRALLLALAATLVLGGCMPSIPPAPENAAEVDPRIEREVQARIDDLLLQSKRPIEVTSKNAIVKVDGIVIIEQDRYKILEAARSVEGVRLVRDSLTRPSMGSGNLMNSH